jgi:hypothetical protein
MNNRRIRFVFLRAMLLITIAIVGSLYFPSASAAPALPVVARLHWLGLNQISADTNSVTVMKIWHLPETAALERQTLDKLSGWLAGGTNAASGGVLSLTACISSEIVH